LPVTSIVDPFSELFCAETWQKFAMKSSLTVPPHLKHGTILGGETFSVVFFDSVVIVFLCRCVADGSRDWCIVQFDCCRPFVHLAQHFQLDLTAMELFRLCSAKTHSGC